MTEQAQARIERVISVGALLLVAVVMSTHHSELANVAMGGALGMLMPTRIPASTVAIGLATAVVIPMVIS